MMQKSDSPNIKMCSICHTIIDETKYDEHLNIEHFGCRFKNNQIVFSDEFLKSKTLIDVSHLH